LAEGIAAYDPGLLLEAALGEADDPGNPPLAGLGRRLDAIVNRRHAERHRRDLAVTNRSEKRHAMTTATAALAGLGCPAALLVVGVAGGMKPSFTTSVLVCCLGCAVGLAAPQVELRRAAAEMRSRWLHTFSCWLELVSLAQAGGMGIESALEAASGISSDDTFVSLRLALERSRHAATTPWEEIARLGDELGIDELGELAASLGLAGLEGARIRSSLQAKSASLRRRQLAEALARANSTTERLFLPSIVLMLGYLIFLIYPAGISLSHVV
jgi:Flp pilus assembly protein TadB